MREEEEEKGEGKGCGSNYQKNKHLVKALGNS